MYSLFLSRSRIHSHGFSARTTIEDDGNVQFFFLRSSSFFCRMSTKDTILRETADTLRALFDVFHKYKHQVISASVGGENQQQQRFRVLFFPSYFQL